jgi:hypothetical protein
MTAAEPDTNFTWEKYAAFLTKVSDTSRYIILPLNEFRTTFSSNKIVIGLRHDVDNDLNVAWQFSETEFRLGVRSTYFILHTAPYYLENSNNMAVHSENIIPVLKMMQDDRNFEIGWHNDLVTLQLIYNIDPVSFLRNELNWLRSNGLKISGTAAHGSNYCKLYRYMNFYFFEECTYPAVPGREYNISVPVGGINVPIKKGKLGDFNLGYEAYFLNNNKAFSDATITNGIRWNIGMLDLNQLKGGDRVIILLHPIHWHKASVKTDIISFNLAGQKTSSVDAVNSTISVEMPYGTNRKSLTASYILSPGAFVKVSGRLQVTGRTYNSFESPLTYTVYAENRDIRKEWTIKVHNAKNPACNFEFFTIRGMTKAVTINTIQKTVVIKVSEGAEMNQLPVNFLLSEGARAWIGTDEQFSDGKSIDFSVPVKYRILAEDGISASTWTVTAEKIQNQANFLSFSVPGLIGPARIDTMNNTIYAEIAIEESLNSLNPSFLLSEKARAWIGKKEQLTDANINSFTSPVHYDIVSKDSLRTKNWIVTLHQKTLSAKDGESAQTYLSVYPNPTDGVVTLQFRAGEWFWPGTDCFA